MKRRPLCLAETERGGQCQNYRDTCPIKSHKRAKRKPPAAPLVPGMVGKLLPNTPLADDPNLFDEVVGAAATAYGLDRNMVERDYWLVRALHSWLVAAGDHALPRGYPDPGKPVESQSVGRVVFGGGTSLSAAWGITERWSQDIDLILDPVPGATPKQMRQACKKGAEAAAKRIGCGFRESSKSAGHYFFVFRDRARDEVASIDIAYRAVVPPLWVERIPVMSMIGRVCDAELLEACPELGGFQFNALGPGTTAMNKLLAQTEMCESGDLDSIRGRARDVYDLACIAKKADEFEGHIGRDSKALLWVAESWVIDDGRQRPEDGFASLRSFDPSTREYEALAEGYEDVIKGMVWGDEIPLPEAIALAVSLDPGPAEPPPPLEHSPLVAYPRH